MWIANGWRDFEVLETSAGEKLERWGNYLLVRPDPQVIWLTKRQHSGWKKPNAHYHRSDKGGGEWEVFDLPNEWSINYKDLVFRLKPMSFKHTGLFPEQAVNWDWCREKITTIQKITKQPLRVLNLFAYTGGATLAAAKAGACVTHVDAAKGMVAWAKENAEISGLRLKPVRWLVDDCQKFVERELRRGSQYDGIIMDPPSYGKGPKGETWKMEEGIYFLLEMAARLLSDEAVFFLLSSYTTGLQPAALAYMLNSVLVPKHGGRVEAGEVGLPVSGDGLARPCGATARWGR
jgi:23S rRNA (cytosine1962-C5)-methyltransferase